MCRRVSILWRTGYVSLYRITDDVLIENETMYLPTIDQGCVMENVANMVEWYITPA